MNKEFKEKEIARCNKVIASYQEDIDALTEEIGELEAKYRKMLEEETKDTQEVIDYYKAMQEDWKAKIAVLSESAEPALAPKKTIKKKKETVVKEEPVQEVVVDTLFPENNEPASEEETVEEIPVVEETIEETKEETAAEEEWAEDLPEETAQGETEDAVIDADEDWPELIEEWK